jgi:glycosyltransferase involved in cell wall biosynthesis
MDARDEQAVKAQWNSGESPVISIVCLTYNQAAFIRETLDGFLIQQTCFPFEIIVHDDASTDGTQAIIQDYAKRYPTLIKPIYQQHNQYSLGPLFIARIFATLESPYIAICEGDDLWTDPHKLQIQVGFLDHHADYVIT